MSRADFQNGLEGLVERAPRLLRGRRVGLLAHPASVDTQGVHASVRLRAALGRRLVALFGPEHGFFGRGGAGEQIGHARHAAWDIPVVSLYGEHRKPSRAMLAGLDALVFDLQDLGIRCYTFVSTLRLVMEACAEAGKTLIVCDRPIPLPRAVDGPRPETAFASFVAQVDFPLVYGLTPGESARLLQRQLKLDLDLKVVPLRGYRRTEARGAAWGPWISPSPGIRAWETAWSYPITVGFEALPAVDYGRGSTQPFQVLSAPWIWAEPLARRLNALDLPGLSFAPAWFPDPGLRLQVTEPRALRPFAAAVALLHTLQKLYGTEQLWGAAGTRPEFFDQLMGTDRVRRALLDGADWRDVAAAHDADLAAFLAQRRPALLYP